MNGDIASRTTGPVPFVAMPRGAAALPVLAVVLLVGWFSVPTLASVVPAWRHYDYSHGYLIPLLTVLLVVVEWRRGPVSLTTPSLMGFGFFLLTVTTMVLAHAATTTTVAQIAMPLAWIGAVWALMGAGTVRRLALPLGSFYFATPIWHFAIDPLQALTISVVSASVRVAGLPVFVEGNFIHLPSGTFEVQGGCAGLGYAIVALALGLSSGVLHRCGWLRPSMLAGVALVLSMLGNWLRVLILVVVGHVSEMQHYLLTVEHGMLGWTVFALCVLLPVLFLDRFLQARERSTGGGVLPSRIGSVNGVMACAVCGVLALGIWLNGRLASAGEAAITAPLRPGVEVPGWTLAAAWEDARLPTFVGATMQSASWYQDGHARVGAFLAHYAVQRQGQEIVFTENKPIGELAIVRRERKLAIESAAGRSVPFREIEVADPDGSVRLVWVSSRVGGIPVASEIGAKVLQAVAAIRGRRDAQVIVLTALCAEECTDARSRLTRYAAVGVDQLYEQADTFATQSWLSSRE